MMGVSARMDEILKIAQSNNLPVLEDNAQSCGGTYRGKNLGTLGMQASPVLISARC